MDVKTLILKIISKQGSITCKYICTKLDISRQAANRHIKDLIRTGKIIKIGKTRSSYYILNTPQQIKEHLGKPIKKRGRLNNKNLYEDLVLRDLRNTTLLFDGLQENVISIISYAFTEMLNNAIDHSQSKMIYYSISRIGRTFSFEINDHGIGVYYNIKHKMELDSELDALQELIKGKITTEPEKHSGEGIFFTSKISDNFTLSSHKVKLSVDNTIDDIFVGEIRQRAGTKVSFEIDIFTEKDLGELTSEYSTEEFQFDRSLVRISLFSEETEYISRSQAKRLLLNLDKYKEIVLDFKNIKTIGQGFADEIFRVFNNAYPDIIIEAINCNKPVEMMIKRARSTKAGS